MKVSHEDTEERLIMYEDEEHVDIMQDVIDPPELNDIKGEEPITYDESPF